MTGYPAAARLPAAAPLLRTVARCAAALAMAVVLAGCCAPGRGPGPARPAAAAGEALPDALPPQAYVADFVLIGEVHDNATAHRIRLAWIEALTSRRRMVVALEQFDAAQQPRLDAARRDTAGMREPAQRARTLAEAAGFDFRGWDWAFYAPVIELALRRDLPLVAANLSRRDGARVARGEVPAAPEPAGWGPAQREASMEAIRDGHCGMLPESMIGPMAAAQRTRDARMADALLAAHDRSGLPVLLLAGNGHVRRDIGVPSYLAQRAPRASVVSIGLPESGQRAATAFDRFVHVPVAPRADPCADLRAPR